MSGVFECEIQARLRDINLGGHVDNVEAIRILDEARILFHHHAELQPPVGRRPGLLGALPDGVVELVGSQRVDYNAEMRYVAFQPFLLRLWDHATQASWPMSDEVRAALQRYEGDPVALRA